MADLYDKAAPKKATNLSLNSNLLEKARGLQVNLSATLEQALSQKLKDPVGTLKSARELLFFANTYTFSDTFKAAIVDIAPVLHYRLHN